jgi:hypothetical protein
MTLAPGSARGHLRQCAERGVRSRRHRLRVGRMGVGARGARDWVLAPCDTVATAPPVGDCHTQSSFLNLRSASAYARYY